METLSGIDISAWQGNPNLSQVAEAGYRFVIVKATEGVRYVSPRLKPEWDEAGVVGLARGVYHFNRFELGPERQAEHFVRTVEAETGEFPEIPHAWDVETYTGATELQPSVVVDHALRGLRHLERLAGVKPLLYIADWYFYMLLKGYHRRGFKAEPRAMELTEFPLWLADYGTSPREMPWPETEWGTPWTFWQRSGSGSVPGVKGRCDLNEFAGSEEQLRSLSGGCS